MNHSDATMYHAAADLLFSYLDLGTDDGLWVLFAERRLREAAWLYVLASKAGITTRMCTSVSDISTSGLPVGGETIVLVLARHYDHLIRSADRLLHLRAPLSQWRSYVNATSASETELQCLQRHSEHLVKTSEGSLLRVAGGQWRLACAPPETGAERVLPGSGVANPNAGVNGTFVADGAIVVNRRLRLESDPAYEPVAIELVNSMVTASHCQNQTVRDFLERAITGHGASSLVGVSYGVDFSRSMTPISDGPSNPRVALQIGVDKSKAHSRASADLLIDLYAYSATVEVGGEPVDLSTLARETIVGI